MAAADAAFETGSADALVRLLTRAVEEGVRGRFADARAAQAQAEDVDQVALRRHAVHAYVGFIHYVDAIYNAAAAGGEVPPEAHGSNGAPIAGVHHAGQ